MSADGTDQTSLTDSSAYDGQPAFSPDGGRIAFTSNRDGDFEIYVMDSDGNNPTRLTNNRASDGLPVFSAGPRTALITAPYPNKPTGPGPIRLTDNLCYYPSMERKLVVSPDGSKVAFNGCTSSGFITDVFVANTDGTGTTNITNNPEVVEGQFGLTFSPDSDKLAFQREVYASGEDDIYMANTDGTGLTNLTNNAETTTTVQWPSFSPDGGKVTFLRMTGPNESRSVDVYSMNTDGTGLTNLTDTPDTYENWPVLSPDGEKVAFVRSPNPDEPPHSDIRMVGSDGTHPTKLSNSLQESEDRPVFSEDGKKVAFARTYGPEAADIYVADDEGNGLTRLTDHPGWEGQPAFIPNSDRIAFVSPRDGDDDVYAVNADGTDLTNLTDTDSASETNPTFSADGTIMVYASARHERSGYLVNEIYVKRIGDTD